MNNIFKNIFRYVLKNKFGYFAVFLLMSIAIMVLAAFSNLSISINKVYSNLINQYNLHNIVINEKYSNNDLEAQKQKNEFYNALDSLGVDYRQFNSINVNNSNNGEIIKIVEYLATYKIDRLKIFESYGLPNVNFNDSLEPTLPKSINFEQIINNAKYDIVNSNITTTADNIKARQQIVYFASKSSFTKQVFVDEFNITFDYIKKNPQYDPIKGVIGNQTLNNVKNYMFSFLDPSNNRYTPIIVRGQRLVIDVTQFNFGIPCVGYFEDPYSYVTVVSNAYLERNKKEIFNYKEFKSNLLNSDTINHNWVDLDINQYPNLISTSHFQNWFSEIDDKYKIYLNNVPYLIVGSGITPDFIYPTISFANIIPDPFKEAIIYANKNGFARANNSFGSMPKESFILAKYKGTLSQEQILNQINKLSSNIMSWPSNITAAYWYNDINNQLTPTAIRIKFINTVIDSFVAIVIFLSIFIIILVFLTMFIFAKNFIKKNKVTLSILISNGLSKNKILFCVAFVASFTCVLAGPIGLLLAQVLQSAIFSILSTYWYLPTPIGAFGPLIWILLTIIPTLIFIGIIFGIGKLILKNNLVNLLKQNDDVKVNKLFVVFSPFIRLNNSINKYRLSIACSSWSKIFFSTILTTLSLVTITFAISSMNKINNAYALETKTNQSKFKMDLITPTIQGGQYFGIPFDEIGIIPKNASNEQLFDVDYENNIFLKSLYNKSPLFRYYGGFHWPTMNDSSELSSNILYLRNRVENQQLLNYFLGIGPLGVNPWNYTKALAPANQINISNELTKTLNEKILSDMRPLNQAYYSNINPVTNKPESLIKPNLNNSIKFPNKWIIGNFNNPNVSTWSLSYDKYDTYDPRNIGFINASELIKSYNVYEKTYDYVWDTPQAVLNDSNNIGKYINILYNTYNNENISSDIIQKFTVKYANELFTDNEITTAELLNDDAILITLNIKDDKPNLITPRSMLLNGYMKKVIISDENISQVSDGSIILDPLDANSYELKQYGYSMDDAKVVSQLGTSLNNEFMNFMCGIYNDPYYNEYFYKITNNIVSLDLDTDEPYVYIDANINVDIDNLNKNIKITGIQKNSKFVNLYSNSNNIINDQLWSYEGSEYPIIINNYASRYFNLKVGDVFSTSINNHVNRYTYQNPDDAINVIKDSSKFETVKLFDPEPVKFKVVNINNTGTGVQMYTTIENAQTIIGLATQQDYEYGINKTIKPNSNNSLKMGMNNDYNSLGGFNGIFTSNPNPLFLTNGLGLYSPSGLYPGYDSWINSSEIVKLINVSLNPKQITNINYLSNALNVTVEQLTNIIKEFNGQTETLVNNIISVLRDNYGLISYHAIYETINSIDQQKTMFNELSNTFDQIMISCCSLILLLSLIIIIIMTSITINEIIKISAILKTLGYGHWVNGSIFFSVFAPSLFISCLISSPIILFLNNLLTSFIMSNINIFVNISFNLPVYFGTIGIFIVIYLIIFLYGVYKLNKSDVIENLKW